MNSKTTLQDFSDLIEIVTAFLYRAMEHSEKYTEPLINLGKEKWHLRKCLKNNYKSSI